MAEGGVGVKADLASPEVFFVNVLAILRSMEFEKTASDNGPRSRTEDTDDHQFGPSSTFGGTPTDVFLRALKVFELLVQCLVRNESVPDHEEVLLSVLAICLSQALKAKSANCTNLMEILANASRLPRWRKPFGTGVQRPFKYDLMPKAEQPPDTILFVAIGVLAGIDLPKTEGVLRNALRLVNNCCQGDDGNRQMVLTNNGVSRLMSLACRHIEPDLVVPALYNLCVDHEPATHQLIHWKAGSADSGAPPEFEYCFSEGSPSECALVVLLSLSDALGHKERKPLLADLLELVSLSVAQDLDHFLADCPNENHPQHGRIDFLSQLILGSGFRLATFDTECRVAVCNTVINLLSHGLYRECVIAGDLVRPFLNLAWPNPSESLPVDYEGNEESEAESHLLQCRKDTLKTLYNICAQPGFATAYPLNTNLAQTCLKSIREPHLATIKSEAKSEGDLLPLSGACVILASLTQSERVARSLVEQHNIHEGLAELLHTVNDQDVLYPAINCIGRLALPVPNKITLLECGLLGAMYRFFLLDTAPNLQREAVITMRRLLIGSQQSLAIIRAHNATRSADPAAKESELAATLALFRRTEDGALKLEIGRLAIEICRVLWSSSDGRPEKADEHFNSTVGACGQEFADAIAFVILYSENPGARSEGWFGFAMMSIWTTGIDLINRCLSGDDMQAEVKKVVASASGPGYQNLRAVLAKMSTLPGSAVSPQTQFALESAAEQMGLARIWQR